MSTWRNQGTVALSLGDRERDVKNQSSRDQPLFAPLTAEKNTDRRVRKLIIWTV
jgi:hypothetical protein